MNDYVKYDLMCNLFLNLQKNFIYKIKKSYYLQKNKILQN